MRSFQQVVLFLFALVAFAFAEDTLSYDATVYVTSTIYKVNTVTMSSSPGYQVANQTSTIAASTPYAVPSNGSAAYPTGSGAVPSGPVPSSPVFPGAASGLSSNGALVAAFVAGLGYLAL